MGYKTDCGFRKHLKVCKFKPEQCRPRKKGDDYGDYCDLYEVEWDVKKLQAKAKDLYNEMVALEKTLKELKKTDKEKYKETKARIRDMFNGGVCIAQAIRWVKRSGNLNLNKKEQRLADKLMKNIKDGKKV